MTDLDFEKERNKVIDEELLIKHKQLINAISCLYKSLGVLTKLTKGMRHIADNHHTMKAHREIMQNLRLAEDYEVELGNILSVGNFGRDEIEADLGKKENKKPNFLYLKHDIVDAIAYAIYYTANPDSEMCIPNCAYEKAEKIFEEWRDETREKKAVELLNKEERNCKNCGKTSCKNYGCDLPFTCGSYKEKE